MNDVFDKIADYSKALSNYLCSSDETCKCAQSVIEASTAMSVSHLMP